VARRRLADLTRRLNRKHYLNTFSELDLIEPLQRAVADQGYERPTPIQAQAIPLLLGWRDVLGCAQTGTGKTAAFALPILQHLAERRAARGKRRIRALVLTPTRELAAQIGESFAAYGLHLRIRHTVIFGGVNERPQIASLRQGVDVLVATPGRLLDLQGRGFVDLSSVEFFVLDEADRMLDMGFIHDVRRVLTQLPSRRQNLLFSATLQPTIRKLADSFLHDPQFVAVTPQVTTVEQIEQSVMFVERPDKRHLLVDLLQPGAVVRAMVFTRTKHGANRLTKQLTKARVGAVAIHGNKSQAARKRALEGFRRGKVQVLVATDIASRGIDVDDVTHVFNFDLPNEPESYIHRIGRTARAGRDGVAVSFCDPSETDYLRAIERTIRQAIPQVTDHEYHCAAAVPVAGARGSTRRSGGGRGSRSGRGGPPRGGGGARGRGRGSRDGRVRGADPRPAARRRRAPRSSAGHTSDRHAAPSYSASSRNAPSFGASRHGDRSRDDRERTPSSPASTKGGSGAARSRGPRRRARR
jgi:ATP-dependent RNA helicase RhlE